MKIFFGILVWSLLFYSCKEVTYKAAQPVGVAPLKEIPPVLFGKYQPFEGSKKENTDTLIIESWDYHFKDSNDKDWLGRGVISDSMVVKFYNDYYFINFKSGDQWVLRVMKQKPSGDLEFLSIDLRDDDKSKETLKKLSKKFKVTELKRKDETFYQINPTPIQLMQLINEGYFASNELKKVK